jgi:hypothetical protein
MGRFHRHFRERCVGRRVQHYRKLIHLECRAISGDRTVYRQGVISRTGSLRLSGGGNSIHSSKSESKWQIRSSSIISGWEFESKRIGDEPLLLSNASELSAEETQLFHFTRCVVLPPKRENEEEHGHFYDIPPCPKPQSSILNQTLSCHFFHCFQSCQTICLW